MDQPPAVEETTAPAPETIVAEAPAEAPPVAEAPAEAPAADGAVADAPKKPELTPEQIAANEERRRRAQAAWQRVVDAKESGEVVSGFVTAAVKGGLLVDVGGIRGFLPASQVRSEKGSSVESLVRTRIPLKVLDVEASRRRIVVSQRRAMEEERRTKRAELVRSLKVGEIREGIVARLADFGVFVDLGGVDGLVPMRELAFERVEKAGDVVKPGDKLNVEVLRIEENGKKITLSRKSALPDPWRDHGDVLQRGHTVEGKVVSTDPRLQVEIAPGIVGTIRESEANPTDYEVGEAIEVTVRNVDRRTRRITLSTMAGATAAAMPTSSGFAPLGVELGRR